MIRRNTNKFVLLAALTMGVLITAVMFTGQLNAQDQAPFQQPSPERGTPGEVFRVGTYNPGAVFDQHPLQEKLMDEYTAMQEAAQIAQQEGDHETLMQLEQQFEQQRNQIIGQFQQDVESALPQVADAAGVKVIALDIAYTASDIAQEDVTAHIVEIVTENDEHSTEPQF